MKESVGRESNQTEGPHWSINLNDKPASAQRWFLELQWSDQAGFHYAKFLLAQGPDENEVQGPINLALFQKLEAGDGLPAEVESALSEFLAARIDPEYSLTQGEVISKLYELLGIRR